MSLIVDRRQVGVLGIQQSGKSAFLTSLIDHLRNHDPKEFSLGASVRKWQIRSFTPLPNPDGTPCFNYPKYRSELHHGQWPAKTSAVSEYQCRFDCSGGGVGNWLENGVAHNELSLIDIPGERVADLGMAGVDFARWSDDLLARLESNIEYGRDCVEYFDLLNADQPFDPAVAVTAFKRAMARFIFNRLPIVTPSTMLLTEKGKYIPAEIIKSRDPDALAAVHLAGVAPDAEFAPISAEVRTAQPEACRVFSFHYGRYQKEIVQPLAGKLYACDQLVVLLDVATLLAGGVQAYNGCRHILEEALRYFSPGRSIYASLADRWLRGTTLGRARLNGAFGFPSIRRIAIVATQADRVHRDDRDSLRHLARELIEPILTEACQGRTVQAKYFWCAAVRSSDSMEYPRISARRKGRTESESIPVSKVPDFWPKDWKSGDFYFPTFEPRPPARAGLPIEQEGLNDIASFILGTT
jgi:predicted YcjX-like family ATPase